MNRPINAKDIKDVISKYLIFHNLKDYVDKIIFNTESLTLYDYDLLKLFIDYHEQSIDEYYFIDIKTYI